MKHGEDYDLWGDYGSFLIVDEATIHQPLIDNLVAAKFTRKQLLRHKDWQVCKEAEWKQLGSYQTQKMFGKPIK
jgi:hypothetical protein